MATLRLVFDQPALRLAVPGGSVKMRRSGEEVTL